MHPLFARRSYRRSFTLVEMLAVVVIIAILAGLVTAGAVVARRRAAILTIQMDVQQLDMAVRSFKEKYGVYPPDFTDKGPRLVRQVRRIFPRCTMTDAQITNFFKGGQYNPMSALPFWLGGMFDFTSGTLTGFSANPSNPFVTGGSRTKPFYDFGPRSPDKPPYYHWPEKATPSGANIQGAYVYFLANDGQYNPITQKANDSKDYVYPVRNVAVGGSGWANAESFQILSAGLDMRYGALNDCPAFPNGTNYEADPEGHVYDNMANFAQGTFEDCMP